MKIGDAKLWGLKQSRADACVSVMTARPPALACKQWRFFGAYSVPQESLIVLIHKNLNKRQTR